MSMMTTSLYCIKLQHEPDHARKAIVRINGHHRRLSPSFYHFCFFTVFFLFSKKLFFWWKNKVTKKLARVKTILVIHKSITAAETIVLLVHENMIARLSDVLAPHLGLVKDKLAMVVKVDPHHEDQERLRRREAGFCHFVPEYMP